MTAAVPLERWWRARPEHVIAGVIVIVSLVLNGWGLSAMGWGNAYYSAAVRSMGSSWHNFFYASFDAGGYVSVDKPPIALWVQVAATKVFGYSRLVLLIPEVLAGAGAVWLLYWGLRRSWGATAGLVAAAVLAVMPINVVVNHSNNTDSVLVLLMTAAAVAAMEAVRTGRWGWLVGAGALAGAAMTTKMLAAAPVMPGILIAVLFAAPGRWRLRLRQVAVGAVVMAIAGLWWFVAVQWTPKADRPYVGSTQTNSVFELAFERNGVRQVEGVAAPLPNSPAAEPRLQPTVERPVPPASAPPPVMLPPEPPAVGVPPPTAAAPRGAGLGGLGFNSGSPGVDRLVNRELGAQIGWLIPFALIGSVAALWATRLRRSPRLGALIVLGCWFAAAALIFSFTKGVVHPYYMAGLGAPLAGLVGIGAATFRFDLEAGRRRAALGGLALAVTAWTEWSIWHRFGWRSWFGLGAVATVLVVLVALIVATVRVAVRRRRRPSRALLATSSAVTAILLAPAMWVQGSLAAGVNAPLPFAQPVRAGSSVTTVNQITPNGGFQFPSLSVPSLVRYLRNNSDGERWMLAVQSAGPAEEIIISSGLPVMAIGGFIGSDPIETTAQLQQRVRNHELRYFLLAATPGGLLPGLFGDTDATTWVTEQCRVIANDVWEHGANENTAEPGTQAFPGGPTASRYLLYDCAQVS